MKGLLKVWIAQAMDCAISVESCIVPISSYHGTHVIFVLLVEAIALCLWDPIEYIHVIGAFRYMEVISVVIWFMLLIQPYATGLRHWQLCNFIIGLLPLKQSVMYMYMGWLNWNRTRTNVSLLGTMLGLYCSKSSWPTLTIYMTGMLSWL